MDCSEARKKWLIPEDQFLELSNEEIYESSKHISNCKECEQYFKNRYKSLMM